MFAWLLAEPTESAGISAPKRGLFRRLDRALLFVSGRPLRGRLKIRLLKIRGQKWPDSSSDWVVLFGLCLSSWRRAWLFSRTNIVFKASTREPFLEVIVA
eukprot:9493599-Pyramimonas_sp.AAC.1